MQSVGLDSKILADGITYVHALLDAVDGSLIDWGADRLGAVVELANLSAMIGNLLRAGIARYSDGVFTANGPHRFPDLLHASDPDLNLEIKVALETNKPKGHLAKPGYHLVARYVLCDWQGAYTPGKDNRGDVAYIWELRFGYLEEDHFNLSNTAGDSGKTAVVNAAGMSALEPVYCDLERCPYGVGSRIRADYVAMNQDLGLI